jgi:cell division protein FtsZ
MVAIKMDEDFGARGAKIIVFGVGGGGGNAVNNMVMANLAGVTFIAANTDRQALDRSRADHKIQLGERATKGLGAGADPDKGKGAANESQSMLAEMVKDADMVFVTAGMGGGTGTGAAPVIAKAAKDAGALTVAVVTRPFEFEGIPRQRNADSGIKELQKCVDSLIVIPNDKLLDLSAEPMTMLSAFDLADSVLRNAVKSVSDLIVVPGLINVDFADAQKIMKGRGKAIMGMGEASGEGRAAEAAQRAMTSPLLEEGSIDGATGVLVNITGGPDMHIQEVYQAMSLIRKSADKAAEIIMGCVIDPEVGDRFKITIIATGFDRESEHEGEFDIEAATTMPAETRKSQDMRRHGILAQQQDAERVSVGVQQQQRRPLMQNAMRQDMSAGNPPPIPMGGADRGGSMMNDGMMRRNSAPVMQNRTMEDDFDPTKPNGWF